jgi:hypothetical protein
MSLIIEDGIIPGNPNALDRNHNYLHGEREIELASIMVSNVERFLFLVGQISSQQAAEKGHAQNR